jgi:hypothetical protein
MESLILLDVSAKLPLITSAFIFPKQPIPQKNIPKTRKHYPTEFTKLQTHFSNPFLIRIIQNLCPNCRELNEESKNPIITQLWFTQPDIRPKYHKSVLMKILN